MGKIINVDLEKLIKIAEYVDDFQKKIIDASDRLASAAQTLRNHNSNEDISDVKKMVEEIQSIIDGEQETFAKLKESIARYHDKIQRMKMIVS